MYGGEKLSSLDSMRAMLVVVVPMIMVLMITGGGGGERVDGYT